MEQFRFFLRDTTARAVSIESVRREALKYLPSMIGTYIESVAEDGSTFDRNRRAFAEYAFVPRAPNGVATPDLTTSLAGVQHGLPVLLAPTGFAGFVRPYGEIALSRAAERKGTRAILSMATSTPVEDVVAACNADHWFQLYPAGNRDWATALIDRVDKLGFTALVVTVDTAIPGKREFERASGLGIPVRLTPSRCLDIARHGRWAMRHLRYRRGFPVLYQTLMQTSAEGSSPAVPSMQAALDWDDLKWLRDKWPRKFYVKGILAPADAQRAVDDIGADGVILSNHGGRQLDGAIAPLESLPATAALIGNKAEILIDGGIRRGSDIVKALCLGAHGVLIGRPHLYGLAYGGEEGVFTILDILEEEMRTTMTLLGCRSVAELGPQFLHANRPASSFD